MLFGFAAVQQVRIPSLTTSRFTLQNAAFLDVVARFFSADLAGDFVPNKIPLPIGMASTGKPVESVPPMVSAPLAKLGADGAPVYPRGVEKLNDTADPNRADAKRADGAGRSERRRDPGGSSRESAGVAGVARGQGLGGEKGARADDCRLDASRETAPIQSCAGDVAGYRKLLAEWPGRIVMAGAELNEALPFPTETLNTIAAWAPNHPVVDACRRQTDSWRRAFSGSGRSALHGGARSQ